MPKIDRWIIASKEVPVLSADIIKQIEELDGQIGGGWHEVHQHISVNPCNKEEIEALLQAAGFEVKPATAPDHVHPEMH